MLEFLERMEKFPRTLLTVFFGLTILLIIISLWLAIGRPLCPKYPDCPGCICPSCPSCPSCPNCPDCNCVPCPVCKKCKKCKDDKSPCAVESMTDCVFSPDIYNDDCINQLENPTSEQIKNCAWISSLYLTEPDKESCKNKCIEMCPSNSLIEYDCPVYCENECCNYDYNCR